ncbi:MAG: FAD-dependent oxidoreductase [Nocardioides sp.]|uniref:FAD-binding oxidoreductase n=1 Tax=Nocardioides sp. TaxID=35761 RepID=UPI0039E4BAD8
MSETSGLRVAGAIRVGEPGYETARRRLSASAVVPDDHPAVIVRVTDRAQIPQALELARAEGLRVTVRSGGHSLAFAALRDGVLALDLSALDRVRPDGDEAVIEPGATSLAVAEALAGTGRAFPVGHKADVALGGFLLAGGNGWNQGRWGCAAESLLAAEVVNADGGERTISPRCDPEAFALLGGAGPGYPGVVAAFRVALQPEPAVHRRAVTFAGAGDVGVAAGWADRLRAEIAPDVELTVFLAPDADAGVRVTVSATAYGADPAHAEALLEVVSGPAVSRAARVEDHPTSIAAMLRSQSLRHPVGQASQQAWSTASYAELLPSLARVTAGCPSPLGSILVSSSSYRRCARPASAEDRAYRQLGTMTVAPYAAWDPAGGPGATAANRSWVAAAIDSVNEHWTGHYIGEVDLRATPERRERCFTDEVRDRLAALRRRWDPEGRFATP